MKPILSKFPLIALSASLLFSSLVFAEPANLTLVKNEIKNYHDSGLYQKELAQVIHQAQQFIVHQAISNQKHKSPQKLAIVLDIDETSLSNYPYMIKRDFTGTKKQYHQDIMAANAPAIKATLALYKDAIHHGVKVFFVTGRHQSERQATEKNLRKAGYTQWAGLYLRPNHYPHKSIIPFKSHTRKLISEQGYTIVATIGDQYSDLKGGYAEKGFKLPNPYYYLP
jgi:acid phosphatase